MTTANAPKIMPPQDLAGTIIRTLESEMPQPWLPHQQRCQECFNAQDWAQVRHIAAAHLDDSFCKAYGYMCSIPKMPPTLAVLLSEAARAIADAHRDAAVSRLNRINDSLLQGV